MPSSSSRTRRNRHRSAPALILPQVRSRQSLIARAAAQGRFCWPSLNPPPTTEKVPRNARRSTLCPCRCGHMRAPADSLIARAINEHTGRTSQSIGTQPRKSCTAHQNCRQKPQLPHILLHKIKLKQTPGSQPVSSPGAHLHGAALVRHAHAQAPFPSHHPADQRVALHDLAHHRLPVLCSSVSPKRDETLSRELALSTCTEPWGLRTLEA